MPRPRLPHLRHEQNRHGNWCWYFRKANGPRIRMPGTYGSDEFRAAYQAALTGEHPALGIVTLRQLLATWVAHDLGHLGQIARVMAKQYRDALAPRAGPRAGCGPGQSSG